MLNKLLFLVTPLVLIRQTVANSFIDGFSTAFVLKTMADKIIIPQNVETFYDVVRDLCGKKNITTIQLVELRDYYCYKKDTNPFISSQYTYLCEEFENGNNNMDYIDIQNKNRYIGKNICINYYEKILDNNEGIIWDLLLFVLFVVLCFNCCCTCINGTEDDREYITGLMLGSMMVNEFD